MESGFRALRKRPKAARKGSIAVAAALKGLNNTHTNAEGQLAGLLRGGLVEKQKMRDEERRRPSGENARGQEGARSPGVRAQPDPARHDAFALIPAGSLALRHASQPVRLASERARKARYRRAGISAARLGASAPLLSRTRSEKFLLLPTRRAVPFVDDACAKRRNFRGQTGRRRPPL